MTCDVALWRVVGSAEPQPRIWMSNFSIVLRGAGVQTRIYLPFLIAHVRSVFLVYKVKADTLAGLYGSYRSVSVRLLLAFELFLQCCKSVDITKCSL